jgi:hypothetical protein
METQRDSIGMEHMIEITVSDGVVVLYRRLICTFRFADGYAIAANGLRDAFETTGGNFTDETILHSAQVGYSININIFDLDFSSDILPRWFFETEIQIFDYEGNLLDSGIVPSQGSLFRMEAAD